VAAVNKDKLKGKGNQAMGTGKEKAGQWTDDPEMEGEGKGQKARGKAQETWGDVKDKARDLKDKAT
jgi:uncharacterized protein YjbJ (UPF0337 family)